MAADDDATRLLPERKDESWRRGYDARDMAIDGMLHRKTSFGVWRERYFRTTLYELSYWSRHVAEIKATEGHDRGSYRYAPVGSASETLDLRVPGTSVRRRDPKGGSSQVVVEVLRKGKVVLDMRAHEDEVDKWVRVLTRIVNYEKQLQARSIGSLRIQIDGLYILGNKPGGPGKVRAAVTFDDDDQDQADESSSTEAESEAMNVLYENTDQADDLAYYAPLQLDTGAVPVRRANSGFTITLTSASDAAEDKGASFFTLFGGGGGGGTSGGYGNGGTTSPAATKSGVSLSSFRSSSSSPPSREPNASLSSPPTTCLASHRATIFEVEYLSNLRRGGVVVSSQRLLSKDPSALDGDATGRWPVSAPDGTPPKKGFAYYPLFAKDAAEDAERPSRIAAMLHARLKYDENVLAVVDLEGKERFEFAGVDDDLAYEEATEASTTEKLVSVIARASDVAEKFSEYLSIDVFDWESPLKSLLCWVASLVMVLALPSSASLALFPLFVVAGLLVPAAFDRSNAKRREQIFRLKRRADDAAALDKKALGVVRVAVVRASNIAAAEVDFVTGTKNSDPFVVLLAGEEDDEEEEQGAPHPFLRGAKKTRVAPTLVGVTDVKGNTLDPVWIDDADSLLGHLPTYGDKGEKGLCCEAEEEDAPPPSRRRSATSPTSPTAARARTMRSRNNLSAEDRLGLSLSHETDFAVPPRGRGGPAVLGGSPTKQRQRQRHGDKDLFDDAPFGGVDATKVSAKLRARVSDEGTCYPAPADFRTAWILRKDDESSIVLPTSYAFPALLSLDGDFENCGNNGSSSSSSSRRVVTFEVFDSNLATHELFLGRAHLPYRDLSRHVGAAAVYELPLERSKVHKRNKCVGALRAAVVTEQDDDDDDDSSQPSLGSLRVVAMLERPVAEDEQLEKYKKRLASDVFERKSSDAHSGVGGKHSSRVSTYGNVKDLKRTLHSALGTLEFATSTLERVWALVTWEFPLKTLLVASGLVCGVAAMLLVPNNLLVAALVSKMFLTGLVLKVRLWIADLYERLFVEKAAEAPLGAFFRAASTTTPKPDPTETQLLNFLTSMPNGPQRDRALANRRAVAKAQTDRNETKAKIGLNFGLRVRFQRYVYVFAETAWERKYALLVDRELRLYDSMDDAAQQPKKVATLSLVPPPLGGCWAATGDDLPSYDDLPTRDLAFFFVAVYVPVSSDPAAKSIFHHSLDVAYADAPGPFKKMTPAKHLFALKTPDAFDVFRQALAAGLGEDNHHTRVIAEEEIPSTPTEDDTTRFGRRTFFPQQDSDVVPLLKKKGEANDDSPAAPLLYPIVEDDDDDSHDSGHAESFPWFASAFCAISSGPRMTYTTGDDDNTRRDNDNTRRDDDNTRRDDDNTRGDDDNTRGDDDDNTRGDDDTRPSSFSAWWHSYLAEAPAEAAAAPSHS